MQRMLALHTETRKMDMLNRKMNLSAIMDFGDITPQVQSHLRNTYTALVATIAAAAVGSWVHLQLNVGGLLTVLAGLGVMMWFLFTPHNESTIGKRTALLMGFGGLQGMSVGPLIAHVAQIDPSIVTTAFVGTCVIFACFSASALFARRRSLLFLGGLLSSALSLMLVVNLMNMFFRSAAVYNAQLYIGLMLFCGFIMFDTQLMIERAAAGDKDYLKDALGLFLDFVNVFVRLLRILSKMQKKNNKGSGSGSSRSR